MSDPMAPSLVTESAEPAPAEDARGLPPTADEVPGPTTPSESEVTLARAAADELGGTRDDSDPLPATELPATIDGTAGPGSAEGMQPPFPPPPAIVPPPAVPLETAQRAAAQIVVAPSVAARVRLADVVEVDRRRRVQLRPSLTIILFVFGLVVGVAALKLAPTAAAPAPADSFPSLVRSAVEPLPASAVAQGLARNDAAGLGQLVDADTLTAIRTQLSPLVAIEKLTFVGTTNLGTDTIAGYVVVGRDPSGSLGAGGLLLRLRDGQVVAK